MKPLSLLTWFIGLLLCTNAQHVIFEAVGQMVNSLNYIHCKFTLDLSSIDAQQQSFVAAVTNMSNSLKPRTVPNSVYEPQLAHIIRGNYDQAKSVFLLFIKEGRDIAQRLSTLRSSLPTIPSTDSHRINRRDTNRKDPPVKPSFSRGFRPIRALGLPFGIFGTFMGIYNQIQIKQLQSQLDDQASAHNKLVEVVQQQADLVQQIDSAVNGLVKTMEAVVYHNPSFIATQLSRFVKQMNSYLDVAFHVIQQAQHRRLAVDLLPPAQLQLLYKKLQLQAKENGCTLLTSQPSDLFQIEMSYFYDGQDVHLLLHVPMVPEDSLLRLFRLHPFPLPLSKTHSLFPITDNNILAISSGFKRYHTQFSHTDLLGCHSVNNVYLCQRMGSLYKDLNSTCLGSLYQQQFDSVKQLCPLEIRKTEEVVHPLLNNWFLAFITDVQTAPIQCRNGTQSEVYLTRGINKFFVSPGCKCILDDHIITSDLNVKSDTDIIHYEWSWDRISLDDFKLDDLDSQLSFMEKSGLTRPTLQDLQTLKMESKRGPGWIAHYFYMAGLVLLVLSLLAALGCGIYYYYVFYYSKNLAARAANAFIGHYATVNTVNNPPPVEPLHLQVPAYHLQH